MARVKLFEDGYKTGCDYGKEICNLEWQQRIIEKRKEIAKLKHKNTDVEGYRWWNNAIESCLHILDELIIEGENKNEGNA